MGPTAVTSCSVTPLTEAGGSSVPGSPGGLASRQQTSAGSGAGGRAAVFCCCFSAACGQNIGRRLHNGFVLSLGGLPLLSPSNEGGKPWLCPGAVPGERPGAQDVPPLLFLVWARILGQESSLCPFFSQQETASEAGKCWAVRWGVCLREGKELMDHGGDVWEPPLPAPPEPLPLPRWGAAAGWGSQIPPLKPTQLAQRCLHLRRGRASFYKGWAERGAEGFIF